MQEITQPACGSAFTSYALNTFVRPSLRIFDTSMSSVAFAAALLEMKFYHWLVPLDESASAHLRAHYRKTASKCSMTMHKGGDFDTRLGTREGRGK